MICMALTGMVPYLRLMTFHMSGLTFVTARNELINPIDPCQDYGLNLYLECVNFVMSKQ